jgi:hypothetical protein
MKLAFAFLADAASSLPNGTFDVIGGGFDLMKATSFPATKHAMALVGRILFEPAECGKQYDFFGELVDQNGNPIFPKMHASFTASPHPRYADRSNWMTVFLNCQGVTFPTPGDYFFRLSVGSQPIGQVIIEVYPEENPT